MSEAVQKRIISHMNKDHTDSLSDYLRYYHDIPQADITDPRMTELSDDGMTILAHADSEDYFIPFEPPLQNLDGIRQRVIDMANEAKSELAAGRHKTYED